MLEPLNKAISDTGDSPENLESLAVECVWEAVSVTPGQLPFGSECPVLGPGWLHSCVRVSSRSVLSVSIGLDLSTRVHVCTDSYILI